MPYCAADKTLHYLELRDGDDVDPVRPGVREPEPSQDAVPLVVEPQGVAPKDQVWVDAHLIL